MLRMQVAAGIHRLTNGVVNFYLVEETRNPLTGRTGSQIAPDGLNRDSEQALASLDALATVRADLLLPGHGEPWTEGVQEAVRLAKVAGRS